MAKLVVMLRVKDGIFFVKEWLENVEKIADEIVVLDNGSTDGTFELLQAHPKVVDVTQTFDYHEGRDKVMMYDNARKRNPDWCLWIDIDEFFEPEVTRADFDRLMSRPFINKYGFRRFHFIDREYFAGSPFRLRYSSGHDRILWREAPGGYFQNLIIDSPNVKGIKGFQWNTNIRIKHLGYINRDIVDKKATLYRSIVPEKEATFQSMYMENERRIRWEDRRNSFKVIRLNLYLSYLRFLSLFPRAIKKIKSIIQARLISPQPQGA